jgi:hypothetical protein
MVSIYFVQVGILALIFIQSALYVGAKTCASREESVWFLGTYTECLLPGQVGLCRASMVDMLGHLPQCSIGQAGTWGTICLSSPSSHHACAFSGLCPPLLENHKPTIPPRPPFDRAHCPISEADHDSAQISNTHQDYKTLRFTASRHG